VPLGKKKMVVRLGIAHGLVHGQRDDCFCRVPSKTWHHAEEAQNFIISASFPRWSVGTILNVNILRGYKGFSAKPSGLSALIA
jgi:hypothetical protein